MGTRSEQTSYKERCINGPEADENVLNTVSHREMQIKSTMRYYLLYTPTTMLILNRLTTANINEDVV